MRRYLIPVAIGLCLLAAACAKRGMPGGGPPDETAPFVEMIVPMSGATEIDTRTDIRITFSEPMKKRTVETGVVVSPPCRWRERYWEDNTYVLVPQENLIPHATYLVSVTNKAADSHGLKMKSTFVGGFSTGVTIDAGRISGSVAWKNVKVDDAAVVVFDADTLLIGNEFPKATPVYLTLTGDGGLFEVPFVDTTRSYWVLAFMDKNVNAELDEGEVTGCHGGRVGFALGREQMGVDVLLCKETLCGSVKGVVDSLTLSLYPQVGVKASSVTDTTLSYEAICSKKGTFTLTCMEPGPYTIEFYADADSNSVIGEADSLFHEMGEGVDVRPCLDLWVSPPPAHVPEAGDTPRE